MSEPKCGRHGWPDDDQDYDNPCVCKLPAGHRGLHACYDCGGAWAGGRRPIPTATDGDPTDG